MLWKERARLLMKEMVAGGKLSRREVSLVDLKLARTYPAPVLGFDRMDRIL